METDNSKKVEKIDNIDIEKHKELFEYEATEVIYALKGEFAAFSGKGTKFEEVVPEGEKLVVAPVFDPKVEVAPEKVELPEAAASMDFELAPVEVEEAAAAVPEVPAGSFEFKAPELEDAKVDVPEIPAVSVKPMEKAAPLEKTVIEVPEAVKPAVFGEKPVEVAVEKTSVVLPEVKLPETAELGASVEKMTVELPDTLIDIRQKAPDIKPVVCAVDVPECVTVKVVDVKPEIGKPQGPAIQDAPKVKPFEKKAVELAPMKTVALPDTTLPEVPELPKEKPWKPIEPPDVHAELPDLSAAIENIINLARKR